MSPTDTKKYAGKLRGFTLIEMLVVIAIIAVLAGMMSIAISAFQRDARMETDNNMAQQTYMGFQNMLTRCEIMQDRTVFDADALGALDGMVQSHSNDALTYSVIQFTVFNTDISGDIKVASYYSTGAVPNVPDDYNDFSSGSDGYEKLRKTIKDNLSFDTNGTMVVYVDYENYTVESAVFFETTDPEQVKTQFDLLSTPSGKKYKTLANTAEQKKFIKNKAAYIGAYPFESAVS